MSIKFNENHGLDYFKIGNLKINELKDFNHFIFFLENDSKISFQEEIVIDKKWRITVKENNSIILAQIKASVKESIKGQEEEAYQACEKFLDILYFKKGEVHFIQLNEGIISAYKKNNHLIISVNQVKPIPIQFKGKAIIEVRDNHGNRIDTKDKNIVHYDALRFFRMANKTGVIIDAYRYLYLAIESALNNLLPRNNMSEIKWLKRSLDKLAEKRNRTSYDGEELKDYFVKHHYKGMRVKLFHSKNNYILPLNYYETSHVYDAYVDLMHIAEIVFKNALNLIIPTNNNITMPYKTFENVTSVMKDLSIRFGYDNNVVSHTYADYKTSIEKQKTKYVSRFIYQLKKSKSETNIKFNKIDLLYNDNESINIKLKEDLEYLSKYNFHLILNVKSYNKTKFDRDFDM